MNDDASSARFSAPFQFRYAITSRDFRAMMNSPYFKGKGQIWGTINKLIVLAWVMLGLAAFWIDGTSDLFDYSDRRYAAWSVVWMVATAGALIMLYGFQPIYQNWYFKRSGWDEETDVVFADDKISLTSETVKSEFNWVKVEMFERTKNHCFVWISKIQSVVVPLRIFTTEAELKAFTEFAESKVGPQKVMK